MLSLEKGFNRFNGVVALIDELEPHLTSVVLEVELQGFLFEFVVVCGFAYFHRGLLLDSLEVGVGEGSFQSSKSFAGFPLLRLVGGERLVWLQLFARKLH